MNQDMLRDQRKQKQLLEQTEVIERPGNITGFTSFYANGVWTPTLVGSGTAGTFTYDVANTGGVWTRIGNRVLLSGRVRITAIGVAPTGNLAIGGLPIVSGTSGQNVAGGVALLAYAGITFTAGRTQLAGLVGDALSIINLFESGSNLAVTAVQGSGLVLVGGVADLRFEGQYQV